MNDTLLTEEVVGSASTRPSAPKVPAASAHTTIHSGTTIAATLPGVEWGDRGATLQPRSLPRYETLAVLGEGGMGEVVQARDNDIGREVAVKRLRVEHQHPELYARFVEEVRTVGQLEHPNIVPIHDAGLDDQGYFFVMKRVEGESLESIIAKLARGDRDAHARWPFERRIDVIRKVLEALRYAHSKGVVHRDIKPANILVGPMGEVFLLDWGIAKRQGAEPATGSAPATPTARATETRVGAVMGTPLYMAPEQARGEPADPRSDLYSLMVTLWELLGLDHPYARLQPAQVMEAVAFGRFPFVPLGKHPIQGTIPWELSWLVQKGTEPDPAKRFQSADELIRRFDDRAMGKVPIQCPITFTKRVNYEVMRFVTNNPRAYMAMMAGLIGVVVYLLVRK